MAFNFFALSYDTMEPRHMKLTLLIFKKYDATKVKSTMNSVVISMLNI